MWIFALKFMHFFWVSGLILNYFEDLFQASLWLGFYVMCNGCSFIKFHNPLVHLLCTCCCTEIFFTPFFFKFNMSDFSQTFSVFNLYCIEWKTARRKRVLVMIPITWLKEEENETRITQKIHPRTVNSSRL